MEDDSGPLNELGRHVVNARLIHEHWKYILRLAGSLKLGKVKATAVMCTLQRLGSLSELGRAVAELGRVEKTQYLLAYVQDEACRRRIAVATNGREARSRRGSAPPAHRPLIHTEWADKAVGGSTCYTRTWWSQ